METFSVILADGSFGHGFTSRCIKDYVNDTPMMPWSNAIIVTSNFAILY
jgi:hypothetical protein